MTVASDGLRLADAPVSGVLLSGSFNPLHAGHEQLAHAAGTALGLPWSFELPIVNADKPPLGYAEIERRLDQFRGIQWCSRVSLCLWARRRCSPAVSSRSATIRRGGCSTRATTMARPGATPRSSRSAPMACRLLVAGRVAGDVFYTLDDLAIPANLRDLFIALPKDTFRVDLSSSELREWRAAGIGWPSRNR